jgi:hypothetical protein
MWVLHVFLMARFSLQTMNATRWILVVALLWLSAGAVSRAATMFGPVPYLSLDDTPAGLFAAGGPVVTQTFEDATGPWLTGFTVDCGSRIGPNSISGGGFPVTDSVDGDDGTIDGSGTLGGSWFCESNDMLIRFLDPVVAAGVAVTDGDRRLTNVRLEFLGLEGSPIATFDPGRFVDEVYNGTTAEDRFMGVRSPTAAIAAIRVAIDVGTGFEIDHLQFQAIPEPAGGLLGMGLGGFAGRHRSAPQRGARLSAGEARLPNRVKADTEKRRAPGCENFFCAWASRPVDRWWGSSRIACSDAAHRPRPE